MRINYYITHTRILSRRHHCPLTNVCLANIIFGIYKRIRYVNMKRKDRTVFGVECAVKIRCFVSLLFGVRTMIPREREGLSELLCGFDVACDFEGNYSTSYVSTM